MKIQQVNSSDINSVGYDAEDHILAIEFHSGGFYQYSNVPDSVYRGLTQVSSKGSYFHQFIKNQYSFRRIR